MWMFENDYTFFSWQIFSQKQPFFIDSVWRILSGKKKENGAQVVI
jgi:hypothetical protein